MRNRVHALLRSTRDARPRACAHLGSRVCSVPPVLSAGIPFVLSEDGRMRMLLRHVLHPMPRITRTTSPHPRLHPVLPGLSGTRRPGTTTHPSTRLLRHCHPRHAACHAPPPIRRPHLDPHVSPSTARASLPAVTEATADGRVQRVTPGRGDSIGGQAIRGRWSMGEADALRELGG